jgi:tRNA U34 5-methylaminomethyl-2-thiouridine-forming methyltransferase MnmC
MPVFLTDDGSHSFLSEQFGVSYHSTHGAIQETQHIFIDAGLKNVLLQNLDEIVILELGFGTGLNALMTWIEAERSQQKIRYITYEMYPLSIEDAETLNYHEQLHFPTHIFKAMHHCSWNVCHELSPFFLFEKRMASFESIDIDSSTHLIYFDAFAPEIQPQLWGQPIMQKMYDALCGNGVLTTYCSKGKVKRILKEVGFKIEPLPGPPFKREITRAVKTF